MTINGSLLSTYNYLVPAAGTTSGWSAANVVAANTSVDFGQVAANSGIPFNPSGVVIDNTNGTVPVVITIQQTGFNITCPVGKQMGLQFPAPANVTAIITANGANIAFVDFPVLPYQF